MIESGPRPAALAEMAARSAAAGSPRLDVVVHHLAPAPPQEHLQLELSTTDSWEHGQPFLEFLGFSTYDVGVANFTRFHVASAQSPRDLFQVVPSPGDSQINHGQEPGIYRATFRAEPRHTPAFVYDTRKSFEVLLTLDGDVAAATYGDALMIAEALAQLSRAAAAIANAPILFLQCPVAPHNDPSVQYRTDGSGEQPRPSQSLAIRMAVGLEQRGAAERVAMVDTLRAFSESHGMGLQVSDLRLGRVRGEWWSIVTPRRERYFESRESTALEVVEHSPLPHTFEHSDPVRQAYLLTAVGPARVGSSLAILSDLQTRNIGIVGASVSALQETAFINLLIPVSPALDEKPLSSKVSPMVEGIGEVASLAALTPLRGARKRVRSQLTAALDYQALRSGPYEMVNTSSEQNSYAMWVSWEVSGISNPTVTPATLVREFLGEHDLVRYCSVTYSRIRQLPSGRFRGRAKLAVGLMSSVTSLSASKLLTGLAVAAEERVESTITLAGDAPKLYSMRVGWRERWLGAWSTNPL